MLNSSQWRSFVKRFSFFCYVLRRIVNSSRLQRGFLFLKNHRLASWAANVMKQNRNINVFPRMYSWCFYIILKMLQ